MPRIRKNYSDKLKFKAAIEMIKGEKTISEIAQEFEVHQSVLQRWKSTLMDEGPSLFSDKRKKDSVCPDRYLEMESKIGRLVMEVDYLKKACRQ